MEIVVKIPDQKYKWIVDNPQTYTDDLCEAIRNGTPLLKGHGRIIDESKITKCYMPVNRFDVRGITTDAPTIIEAEGSDSE